MIFTEPRQWFLRNFQWQIGDDIRSNLCNFFVVVLPRATLQNSARNWNKLHKLYTTPIQRTTVHCWTNASSKERHHPSLGQPLVALFLKTLVHHAAGRPTIRLSYFYLLSNKWPPVLPASWLSHLKIRIACLIFTRLV